MTYLFSRYFWRIPAVILIILGSLTVENGCTTKTIKPKLAEDRAEPELQISYPGYNHFINANLLELNGNYDTALREYELALTYIPESQTIRTDYARLLFRRQRIDDALAQAEKVQPKDAEIYLLIGDCYRTDDSIPQAIEAYRQTVALDPDNLNAYWYLADLSRRQGNIDSAIDAYYEVCRLSSSYRAWNELAMLLGQAQRYPEALDAFRKSIEMNETPSVTPYLGIAASYDAMDSLPQAETALDEAIKIDKYDVRIFRQMEMMYSGRGLIDKAVAASEQLVALVPSDWVAQRRLGLLLYTDEKYDRADSLFADRISFGDDNILNYFYRGLIALNRERYPDAMGFFKTVTEKENTFLDGWLNLGFAYRQMDSLDQAIEIYRQTLPKATTNEEKTTFLFALGSTLERDGQFYEAVETFKKLIDIDANHAPALNYLGYMLADHNEQLKYALELIERAISLSPDNGAYIDSYAWVKYRLGDYNGALTELKKAVDLIDNDAVIYEHLGDVYKAMGNNTEAKSQYRRALELDPGNVSIEEKVKE